MAVSQKVPQYVFVQIPSWPQHFQQDPYNFEDAPAVFPTLLDTGGSFVNDPRPYI